jgi:hypothetical protein
MSAVKSFRSALVQAAEEAHDSGDIALQDLRRIRLLSLMPRQLKMMEQRVITVARKESAEGLPPIEGGRDNQVPIGFDWSGLLAFLKEFLPILLELFKLS